ncbi:MAG: hypothetical protein IT162_07175, partial [Bryobacterales bacterium]|nr:hypothetical protein [Bryobacterales bacterium]
MRSSRKRGVILIVFALGTFVLCGFAGLALDVSYLQMWQRKAQTAADAAAIAAALDLKRNRNSQSASGAAFVDAAANGFTHNADSTVVVENPPLAGPNQGNNKYVRVSVQRPAPTYFMRVFGRDSVTVGAHASSGLADMGLCVFVLHPTTNAALHVSGTPDVNVSCAVQVNSNSTSALHVTGAAEINTTGFNVVGGAHLAPNATITPAPATGMSPEDDPLAWRANPPSSASCDYVNFKVSGGNRNNALELQPGVYCGGIDITTHRRIEFESGLYVLMGG